MTENLEYSFYPILLGKTRILSGATSGEVVEILDLSYYFIVSLRQEIIKSYGIDSYMDMIKESIWNSTSLLSFDDFYKYPSIRNNIHCFFYGNYVGEVYRSQDFYKKFARENPELDQNLKKIYGEKSSFSGHRKKHIVLLYSAYKIMLSYAEIKKNYDLFI